MNQDSPFLLSVPRGRAQVTTTDEKPVRVLWSGDAAADNIATNACQVCHEHQGRYTCPKCSVPYCSVACYRNHASDKGCTEAFYQDRVAQVLDLETHDKRQETLRVLDRVQKEQYSQLEGVSACGIPENQLYEILIAIENEDENKLVELLEASPAIRAAVERGITHDNLDVLEQWHPWWCAQLSSLDEDAAPDNAEPEQIGGQTLDELLLSVPPFEHFSKRTARPELPFNLIDILYSVAWTFRLYHGPQNAKEIAQEVASTLIQSSCVLAQDARYGTLQEALTSCTRRSTECFRHGIGCNTHWQTLAYDVAAICACHRHVARCLFEAMNLFQVAAAVAKKQNDKEQRGQLKLVRKKLEFYTSWSRANTSIFPSLSRDVKRWIESWTPDDSESSPVVVLPNGEEVVR